MDSASRQMVSQLGQRSKKKFQDETNRPPTVSVLVADDTPAYERIIGQVLQQRGYRVTFAKDGREALDQYSDNTFDVVVLDVQMPRMDGFEVTKKIRERERSKRHIPIIGLSAHSTSSYIEKCIESGMDACLTKPLEVDKLVSVIENLVQDSETPTGAGCHRAGECGDDGEVVDYAGAMGRLGGDVELFREFVKVYDEDVPPLMNALRRAVLEQTASNIERNAHSLRGLISNFGAKKAVEAAYKLEGVGKQSKWDELEDAVTSLEYEIERLTAALEPYR